MAKNGKHFRALEEAKAAGYRVRKDNFNRRLGVQIACGRALKAAQGR